MSAEVSSFAHAAFLRFSTSDLFVMHKTEMINRGISTSLKAVILIQCLVILNKEERFPSIKQSPSQFYIGRI